MRSAFYPQTIPGNTRTQSVLTQSLPVKSPQTSLSIPASKITYSLIESQVLPYVPVYTHAVHLHLTFTAPSQSEVYLEPSLTTATEHFCENS